MIFSSINLNIFFLYLQNPVIGLALEWISEPRAAEFGVD